MWGSEEQRESLADRGETEAGRRATNKVAED